MGRRLGQHFLVRESVLARIAAAACPAPGGLVIEIGPGKGALTRHLVERASRVVAIELDPLLAAGLRDRFAGCAGLEIVEGDALAADLRQWGPARVAGNLPYYIASPLIERALALGPALQQAVFLVQEEVAERLTARPGSRSYGFLSVSTQVPAIAELLFRVPPAAFRPPPKVNSAVVRLTPRPEPAVPDPEGFLRFAALAFRHKRKTLRNNLAGAWPRPVLDALGAGSLRAEQLPIDQLHALYLLLPKRGLPGVAPF